MSLQYNKNIIPKAKELRKNMTPQERKLWYLFLSKYQPRFQRQKTIGSYIADFYCFKAKLIIEIDGNHHFTSDGIAYDEERTKILNAYNLDVVRFTNFEIDESFVCISKKIDNAVRERLAE